MQAKGSTHQILLLKVYVTVSPLAIPHHVTKPKHLINPILRDWDLVEQRLYAIWERKITGAHMQLYAGGPMASPSSPRTLQLNPPCKLPTSSSLDADPGHGHVAHG